LSVIIPFDVEIIAIPNPFNTFGISFDFAYTLKPGFETLFNPVITLCFFFVYFKVKVILPCTSSFSTL